MSRHNSQELFTEEGRKYDALRIKGDSKSDYDISAVSMNVKGALSASKNITVDTVFNMKGRLSAGIINAPDIKIHGNISVKGIDGKNIKIVSGSDGSSDYVHGGNIEIRCGDDPEAREELLRITGGVLRALHIDDSILNDIPKENPDKNEAVFTCREISGEDISLAGVTCTDLSGRNITLSRNCKIENLSYSGTLSADGTCTITSTTKL